MAHYTGSTLSVKPLLFSKANEINVKFVGQAHLERRSKKSYETFQKLQGLFSVLTFINSSLDIFPSQNKTKCSGILPCDEVCEPLGELISLEESSELAHENWDYIGKLASCIQPLVWSSYCCSLIFLRHSCIHDTV